MTNNSVDGVASSSMKGMANSVADNIGGSVADGAMSGEATGAASGMTGNAMNDEAKGSVSGVTDGAMNGETKGSASGVTNGAMNELVDELADALAKLQLSASEEQLNRTLAWLNLIARWNDACGLTSIPDWRGRVDKLVLDSLTALPFMRSSRILDIGSGAGAPGIPLAIFASQHDYTLIDAVLKKAQFLERCADDLRLSCVHARHQRAEQMKTATPYDTIIARGVGTADRVLRSSLHLAKPTTRWVLFKSAKSGENMTSEVEIRDRRRWHIEYIHAPRNRDTLSLMIVEQAR